jgi:glycosyltransferase involved in cell wall biosynthesis
MSNQNDMQILHVVQGYTPAIGGTERVVQKISEQLVARHGDTVMVYTTTAYNCELFWRRDQPQLPVGVEKINGVTVRRFAVFNYLNRLRWVLAGGTYQLGLPYNDWFRAWYNGPHIPGLRAAIAHTTADVIAASSFPLLHMHDALRGGKRAKKPVVFYGGIHAADAFGFERPMIYQAIRQADAYIAYSTFERAYLSQRGVPAEKITVIGAGVDSESFRQVDGQEFRRRLGWEDATVVAFIGQQVPHKGIDLVLEAMQTIWHEYPQTCLLIAGARSTYSSTIQNIIAQLPPERRTRVKVIDDFAEDEKPMLFAASDIVVYPSGYESFGIVFVEAWAAGKPVIGARVGAVPTVVNEGKDGILIRHRDVGDLIDAIRTLIVRPELRRQLGEAGRQKVLAQYTWDMVADKFRLVYRQVMNQSVEQETKHISF